MRYFKPETDPKLFSCSCGCNDFTPPVGELLTKLDQLRRLRGKAVHITSGPRCTAHNEKEGGRPSSAHLTGEAADIYISSSADRFEIIKLALESGFNRIGIARTFIHVDVSHTSAQSVVWLYN